MGLRYVARPLATEVPPSTISHIERVVDCAIMSKEEDNAVFEATTNEDVRLENLGYEQGESN
jgi:hypothetical protein